MNESNNLYFDWQFLAYEVMETKLFKKLIVLWLLIVCMLPYALAKEEDLLEQVESSARSWLEWLDHEKYPESWQNASLALQKKTSEAAWIKTVTSLRNARGKPAARYIATASSAKSLSGFVDGEYVVLQFYTTFAEKGLALETVTLVKSNDSTGAENWKMVEYSIR